MSTPEKKKKTTKKPSTAIAPTPQLPPIPSLPDDLLSSCFARVSRLHYPTISLVSKSFRPLLASPDVYKTRNRLGLTEICLYVCLKLAPDSNPKWFTLCRKPNRTLSNHTGGYVLATLQIPHSPPAHSATLVALSSNIYNIGQSSVSVLDCRTHTWHEGPSMRVERNKPSVNVVNGKIYVAGGCKDCNFSNWMEVFDPKTKTWESKSNPLAKRSGCRIIESAVINGEIYMFGNSGVAYKPEEDKWVELRMTYSAVESEWGSYCVIDDVLYRYDSLRKIEWFDYVRRSWIHLKGLPEFPSLGFLKLANYGGKMAIFWDVFVASSGYENKMIWCAVFSLEKCNGGEEMWGNIEWFDALLTVPASYQFVCALATTV